MCRVELIFAVPGVVQIWISLYLPHQVPLGWYMRNIGRCMLIVCFIVFVIAAAWSEYALMRHMGHRRKSASGVVYLSVSVAVWAAMLLSVAAVMTGMAAGNGIMRAVGIVLLVFLFNGVAKILFALLGAIGRRAGCPKVMAVVAGVLTASVGTVLVAGTTYGRSSLRVERIEVMSSRLPEGFDGFRIALFSDMHTGFMVDRYGMLGKVRDTINALDADMVVNCGDIVNYDYRELDSGAVEILSGIRSRYGVYAVLGNHDLGIYMRDTAEISRQSNVELVMAAQHAMGWRVLRDTTVLLARGGDTISLTGLEYPEELMHDSHGSLPDTLDVSHAYAGVPHDMFNITMSHAPQAWRGILSAGRGDLTMSGHVHSLQVKFRFGDRVWSPAALLYDEWSGPYVSDGNMLYINDGVGYVLFPLRIGTRPEITLLELKCR